MMSLDEREKIARSTDQRVILAEFFENNIPSLDITCPQDIQAAIAKISDQGVRRKLSNAFDGFFCNGK